MQVDGSSHVVHSEEEALGTRLTIDSRTCLLSNEHDPSKVGPWPLSWAVQPDAVLHVRAGTGHWLANQLACSARLCWAHAQLAAPPACCCAPQMLAISTGKLVRYLGEDGGHIAADAPYAEVEVMKMMMTLLAPASGALRSCCGQAVVVPRAGCCMVCPAVLLPGGCEWLIMLCRHASHACNPGACA